MLIKPTYPSGDLMAVSPHPVMKQLVEPLMHISVNRSLICHSFINALIMCVGRTMMLLMRRYYSNVELVRRSRVLLWHEYHRAVAPGCGPPDKRRQPPGDSGATCLKLRGSVAYSQIMASA
jgi:hypothetical protein